MTYGNLKLDSITTSTKTLNVDDLAATSEWILGAVGSSGYTFTGPGLIGAESDPTLYLVRGQQYRFTNTMGAHPFRIQSTVNGSTGTQYDDGIVNNNVSNGTLTWNVQFDAPGILYYQCTAHGGMGGKIYIVDAGVGADVNINTTGTITGAAFVGDGSGLTGVSAGGAILYNRRPALHRGSLFYKTAATTISIVAGSVLNGHLYAAATAVTMPSHGSNIDYAIWQHPTTAALVGDASFTTAPAGAAGGSIVGGYHHIPSGRPTAFNNGSPTGAAEILEFSLWDLTWRPTCPDPRGMACIEGGFWIDLYLCGATSYAGATFSAVPSSKIGLTIGDGSSAPLVPAQFGGDGTTTYGSFTWYEASEMAASFGKRLPFYAEFAAAAYGAPEAGSRGTDPGTVIWERASKFGLAQATGTLWQWGADTAGSGAGGTWSATTEGRGSVYSTDARAVVLGGDWSHGAGAGSRDAYWSVTPWNSGGSRGARFAAGHLVLG